VTAPVGPTQVGMVSWPAGYDRPIASMARNLLSKIEDTYTAAGIVLPTRRYVAVGALSAVDDEQLVVMYGGVYVGLPGNELVTAVGYEDPRSVTFNVELWRNIPALTASGNAPSAAVIAAASEEVMHDSWLLLEAAFSADQTSTGVIARSGVNEPQGEYQGVSMIVEMRVP
jgi:hypothetical protein